MDDVLKLYLDDVRPTPDGWVPARDVDEAISILSNHKGPFEVSLDHDLGTDENDAEKPNGCALIKWMAENGRFPAQAQIHSANPVGRKNLQFDLDAMQRHMERTSTYKVATWADVFAKAKHLKDSGMVIIQRNGYDNVVAQVRGYYGVYEVEFQRQDPNSRAISMWSCTCPWAQFVWYRTGPWRKYEGRVCSHCLAAYWQAKSTPLDDDALEQFEQQEELGQKPPTPLDDILPGGDEGPPATPGAEMMQGPEEEIPDEFAEIMPSELPIEPDETQGPLPAMPELPFKPNEKGEYDVPDSAKGELPNPIQQGLLELQNQLGPEQTNFLRQQYPQFFKIPGVLGAAGNDFDAIYGLLHPGPGKNPQQPTAQMVKEEWGELRGGVHPHPQAVAERYRADKTPIYRIEDMGWHPGERVMHTQDRAHKTPEKRGDYARIPTGVHVTVIDADPTTKWVKVSFPLTDTAPLQARRVEAWVESSAVKLIGSERMHPERQRRAPDPEATAWQPDEPEITDDWA